MIRWMLHLDMLELYLILILCGVAGWFGLYGVLRLAARAPITRPGSAWDVTTWRRYRHHGKHHQKNGRRLPWLT